MKYPRLNLRIWGMLAMLSGLWVSGMTRAQADAFLYNFDQNFTGINPANPPPWTSALFQDVAPGTVRLTLSNLALSSTEFVSGAYFNLNPNYNPLDLNISLVSGSSGVVVDNIYKGVNLFKADGDGKYDVLFSFSTVAGRRFEAGDQLVYQLSGITGLNVWDFNYLSAPAGGKGPFLAAEHIQGINGSTDELTGSMWARPGELTPYDPVPEPATGALLALGGALWRWRRK